MQLSTQKTRTDHGMATSHRHARCTPIAIFILVFRIVVSDSPDLVAGQAIAIFDFIIIIITTARIAPNRQQCTTTNIRAERFNLINVPARRHNGRKCRLKHFCTRTSHFQSNFHCCNIRAMEIVRAYSALAIVCHRRQRDSFQLFNCFLVVFVNN